MAQNIIFCHIRHDMDFTKVIPCKNESPSTEINVQ